MTRTKNEKSKTLSREQIRYRDDPVFREQKKAKSKARYYSMTREQRDRANEATQIWRYKHTDARPKTEKGKALYEKYVKNSPKVKKPKSKPRLKPKPPPMPVYWNDKKINFESLFPKLNE